MIMLYIDLNLEHCEKSSGEIAVVYPHVRIGMDVKDNFDVERLRAFNERLQQFLYEGINGCLNNNKPNG